jgi:hypothetical protein
LPQAPRSSDAIGYRAAPMSEQAPEIEGAPTPPPEVEQAVLLGHIPEAISAYITHTGVDLDTARAVVERLVEEHS